MKIYHDLLNHILTNGKERTDRTGVGTLSVFGYHMRHNIADGFPLLTTKKMFLKGCIHEILWFIRGSTDVKELQDVGVNFWNSWVDEEGTIGPGYGKQLRNIEYITPITPKRFEKPKDLPSLYKDLPPIVKRDKPSKTAFEVGEVFDFGINGKGVLLEELPSNESIPRIHWRLGFIDTGHVCIVKYKGLQELKVKDPFRRSVFGVGYYGDTDWKDKHLKLKINTWREMLRRCYHNTCNNYKYYGGKGVHVSNDWQCFAVFQKEVERIPGWNLKKDYPSDYSLDKDILWLSNRYGKDTCMWASEREQSANTTANLYFKSTSPEGKEHTFSSLGELNRNFGLNIGASFRCLNGKLKKHHGWSKFEYLTPPEGHVFRWRIIDQLKELVSSLRHDPDSRRHVISLWNPHDIDRMKLPPCHGNIIQFYVNDGVLSCQMYQRSGDAMLGIPVNIASYSLLTMMLSQVCNMVAGEFIHTIGDAHLYKNHLDQARLQLTRECRPLPKMTLNPMIKDIDDFKYEDFTLSEYDPHPHIKAEVAV